MVSKKHRERRKLRRYVHTFFICDHSRRWETHTSLIFESTIIVVAHAIEYLLTDPRFVIPIGLNFVFGME